MKLLKLERIGDGSPKTARHPYCKRVLKVASDGFIVTEELKFKRDYTNANGIGSRGVFDYYVLSPGIYEIQEVLSWKSSVKYYLFISNEYKETKMNYEEALLCLSGGSILMS